MHADASYRTPGPGSSSITSVRLQLFARSVDGVRRPSPLVRRAGPIAAEHVPRLPAGELHQVAFVAAGGQPAARERVPEPVRVDVLDAGLGAQLGEDLAN